MSAHVAWITATLCSLLGVFMVAMRPRLPASWMFLGGMALLGSDTVVASLLAQRATLPSPAGWENLSLLWIKSLMPGTWLAFSNVFARGEPENRLRGGLWLLMVAFVLPAALVLIFPGGFQWSIDTETGALLRFRTAGKLWLVALLAVTLAALVNLEQTYRGSIGMVRWRIKYTIIGLCIIFGVDLYMTSQSLLFSGYAADSWRIKALALGIGCMMVALGMIRSGHIGFDIYPSRRILQGSVTLVLAGVYFLIVGLLALWASRSGDSSFPSQALVLLLGVAGVAVMLLSNRFRTRVRVFVSNHFHRPEHDYRKIWTDFTLRTSNQLDAARVARSAAELVAGCFHVLSVTIFRASDDQRFLEWLSATEPARNESGPVAAIPAEKRATPFSLERETSDWANGLKLQCEKAFDHGGERWVVPLVVAERLVGAMVLADRVSGIAYSQEELDLLKCIGDQLAATLLNCSLTEEILRAKEVEAFQTLSTFFVHDLKNAANGLGLMLQNLPIHFDDPEFRSDAIRGVSGTVDKINRMILKLGNLRRETTLASRPYRLDQLCREVIDEMRDKLAGEADVTTDLTDVPELPMDPDAMRTVLTNLLLNANESMDTVGEIRVRTHSDATAAELEVSDTGCGMTTEFLRTQLFKPFHSTKTHGLGIGMFQCRKIIEAHGGSIDIRSVPNSGTTVTVRIPFPEPTPQLP